MRGRFEHGGEGGKSRGALPRVLIALALCGGCAGQPRGAPPPADGRNAAEPFLTEIRNSRIDAAWDSTTAEFKSDMGRERFRKLVQSNRIFKEPLEFAGYEPDQTNGITRGACDYRTPADAKVQAKVRVLVAREGDFWKVERLIIE